ncbi:uncharacterized protein METZ01_LOCUS482000, partial [marine metagenome]
HWHIHSIAVDGPMLRHTPLPFCRG